MGKFSAFPSYRFLGVVVAQCLLLLDKKTLGFLKAKRPSPCCRQLSPLAVYTLMIVPFLLNRFGLAVDVHIYPPSYPQSQFYAKKTSFHSLLSLIQFLRNLYGTHFSFGWGLSFGYGQVSAQILLVIPSFLTYLSWCSFKSSPSFLRSERYLCIYFRFELSPTPSCSAVSNSLLFCSSE